MKRRDILILVLISGICRAQVNIATGSYSQNFGTGNITSWVNNSTFPGWYISGTFVGQANLSASANSYNSGGFYSYNCGSDSKIGSRASGSASNLYCGVVLRNTTGQTIRSIRVSYTGFQMSLAQNGGNINTTTFDYIVSTAAPAITASGGTSVPALDFQQLQNSTVSGSSQINWYPCTQSSAKSACVPVTIANNSYILLRWRDTDDGGNDHHMAIDNIQVDFDMTGGTCLTFLPVELMYFNATYNGAEVDLGWATASEKNNSYFTVERSHNGINFEEILQVKGASISKGKITYREKDNEPFSGISYYRLKQTDGNGAQTYSVIEAVEINQSRVSRLYPNPTTTEHVTLEAPPGSIVTVINGMGQVVLEETVWDEKNNIDLGRSGKGIYNIIVNAGGKITAHKVVSQ